jgi:hypothetical protein
MVMGGMFLAGGYKTCLGQANRSKRNRGNLIQWAIDRLEEFVAIEGVVKCGKLSTFRNELGSSPSI